MSTLAEPVVAWRGSTHPTHRWSCCSTAAAPTKPTSSASPTTSHGAAYAAVREPIAEGGGYAWFANRGIGRPVRGVDVVHLMHDGRLVPHVATDGARLVGQTVVYDLGGRLTRFAPGVKRLPRSALRGPRG